MLLAVGQHTVKSLWLRPPELILLNLECTKTPLSVWANLNAARVKTSSKLKHDTCVAHTHMIVHTPYIGSFLSYAVLWFIFFKH